MVLGEIFETRKSVIELPFFGKILITIVLRSLTSYQQLMLNRVVGGRVVVLGGEECQRSRGETGLLYNREYGEDVPMNVDRVQ